MVRKYVKALVTLSIIAVTLVGCGKAEQTGVSNEIGAVESTMTENTEVAENETETVTPTPTETPTEALTPTEEPTPVPTEESTPIPTEEPTTEPTEEPTPTPEPVHEHSYTETIIVKGTCTTWGTKRYTCSCGDSYEKEYALDHVSDGNRVMVVEPNCTTEGISAEHCIYCGERMYAELASGTTGHVPKDHWEYFTHTGNYYLACSICNRVIEHTTTRPEGAEIREITPVDSNTLQPVN